MRYLDWTDKRVPFNLALDEALLDAAEEDGIGPILRTWESDAHAVILGASSRLTRDVRLDACQAEHVPVFRRSSGGGTVVIGPGALNVTLVLPLDAGTGLGAVDVAQRFALEPIANGLDALISSVRLQGSSDLTLGDRKFGGSAQRRLRRYFMVHASLLYDMDLDRLERYLSIPDRQPDYRGGRTHADFVTNLGLPRAHLVQVVRQVWGAEKPLRDDEVPWDRAGRLMRSKFNDASWVGRF
jgi:lipoate-protein ligase A